MKRQCSPYENLTNLHAWLCQRAGADRIATYRVEDVMMDLNISKPCAVQSLRRLTFAGAVENISKAKVERMLLRVDLVHPVFTPKTWNEMVQRAKDIKAKTHPYRPLPEYTGHRDPYTCAAPLLAYMQARADADGIFAFDLEDLRPFGTDAIVLATVQHLVFKKRLIPLRPINPLIERNYTVKIVEAPHAT